MDKATCIKVSSLTTFEVDPAGRHVQLDFVDCAGKKGCIVLPADSLQQLLMSLPKMVQTALRSRHGDNSLRLVHPLNTYSLEIGEPDPAGHGQLILTLCTEGGFSVSFSSNAAGLISLGEEILEQAPVCETKDGQSRWLS